MYIRFPSYFCCNLVNKKPSQKDRQWVIWFPSIVQEEQGSSSASISDILSWFVAAITCVLHYHGTPLMVFSVTYYLKLFCSAITKWNIRFCTMYILLICTLFVWIEICGSKSIYFWRPPNSKWHETHKQCSLVTCFHRDSVLAVLCSLSLWVHS